jgi:hypothetical protein
MPSGEIWGGNGPAAGALIGLSIGAVFIFFLMAEIVVGS